MFCSIRGTLLSTLYAVENLGVLLAYIIGEYFQFYAMPLFSIILIAAFAILLLFVPESPIFLIRANKIEVSVTEEMGMNFTQDKKIKSNSFSNVGSEELLTVLQKHM